jgi:hypothetical protein
MESHLRKLHFHRYEFKYTISGEVADTVLSTLETRMERDSHSSSEGSYFVRSLYFDTSTFAYHRQKEDGLHSRYKFRIRSYSPDPVDPVFLELKGKQDCLVYKHRHVMPFRGFPEAMAGGMGRLCSFVMESPGCNGVGRHFVADCFRNRLSPSVLVDYCRTAFENRANPDFRATIDRNVTAWKAGRDGSPTGPPEDLSPGFDVLEIKFRYHLPGWFHRLAQGLELTRVSFSKFYNAGDRLWMANTGSRLNRMVERGRSWPL